MIELVNVSQASDNMLFFVIQGDGESTEFKAAINKDPFNLTFNNPPSGFSVTLSDPDNGTATASLATVGADEILTIEFSQAPPADETLGVPVSPFWDSVA